MSGRSALAYLKEICRQLDEGSLQANLRKVAVVTAVPVSMLVSGCMNDLYGVPAYGMMMEETVCNDGLDDDYDGLIDCEEEECQGVEYCLGCDDGQDNDGDGNADCDDESCETAPECQ